ncbi:hypothetical protein [Candidatus Poriferisocius sp.]|uniref:hypothetical protein n=1 Tax=Candidatus Poriferisocius sp. TaxID=3101276 RepID=UPI003B0269A7
METQLGSLADALLTLREDHDALNREFRSLETMFHELSAHVLEAPEDSAPDAWAWICEFMVDAYGRYPGPRVPGAIFDTRDSRLSSDDECVRLGYLPNIRN